MIGNVTFSLLTLPLVFFVDFVHLICKAELAGGVRIINAGCLGKAEKLSSKMRRRKNIILVFGDV